MTSNEFVELKEMLENSTEPDGLNINKILNSIVTKSDSDFHQPGTFRDLVRSLASYSLISALMLPS